MNLAKATNSSLMYYVYILKSAKSNIFYYGFTKDVGRRLVEHNTGQSKFTNRHIPWQLEWYCAFSNMQKAKDFELYLKSGSGKAFSYKRLVALEKDAKVKNQVI